MKEASYIEVVFENLESIIIPLERFRKLEFGPLKPNSNKGVDEYDTDDVHIQIGYQDIDLNYDAINDEYPLGMFVNNPASNRVQDRPNILGRLLAHQDIMTLDYLNEQEEEIGRVYVPWNEEDEESNGFMKVTVESGYIAVRIKR
ncbi:hypothetical protein MUN89_02520 [Halobacillus salinarum]|uniref:Uncharacterized protein n=1 Tax=Halobacillus salinarum TaxID=2932257 RepID=A0ABY4EMG9_9BACI|nr:hypothetical protein [Halobacillus salinarum]UOQ44849.1 hypothetical protein MUN89_02520 [Halobacillus salinarum]